MSLSDDIISLRVPDIDQYLRQGVSLDDIDEYGFTPLIEAAISRQSKTASLLIEKGVDINKPDMTGRSALHWAIDNDDIEFTRLLLINGADPNAYTRNGLCVLVYPVLRGQNHLKHLLYQYGAKLDFAMDFIYAKLLGHRFELKGDVDILNAKGEFIELDYEGFILEFTVAVVKDSLRRFLHSYSTRYLRDYFPNMHMILDAFVVADELLTYQHHPILTDADCQRLSQLLQAPLLVFPAASSGHAFSFIRYKHWWAKIDRGENSLKEGSVNIYRMARPDAINVDFLSQLLYKRQPREYFHQVINQKLGLTPVAQFPMTSQIVGNCSWANIQAIVPVAYAMLQMQDDGDFSPVDATTIYEQWVEWDRDRALDECIQRFYLANPIRQASFCAMLAAVLFQACDSSNKLHIARAEKILPILVRPDYYYVLQSYLDIYCVKNLTRKGNNLLKLLEDYGHNPNVGVTPIATGLLPREKPGKS